MSDKPLSISPASVTIKLFNSVLRLGSAFHFRREGYALPMIPNKAEAALQYFKGF